MKKLMVLLLIAAAVGCASKNSDKKFFDEVGQLSKEDIWTRAEALFSDKKYEDARKFYSFLSDSFPNDPTGRRAALKVADTFYARKDIESLTEAQLRYRDFSNRYPNDPSRAYALLMLGKCSNQQAKGALRDLKPLREAADSFSQLLQLFPDSPHAVEARELLAKAREDLAGHELEIAEYYARLQAWQGAVQRLDYLRDTYPDTEAAREGAKLRQEIERRTGGESEETPAPEGTPTPAGPRGH